MQLASELEMCAQNEDDLKYAELLKEIHIVLVKAASNEYLELAMAPLQGLSRRFWFVQKSNIRFNANFFIACSSAQSCKPYRCRRSGISISSTK